MSLHIRCFYVIFADMCLVILSNFYTRTEIATRIAILYTGNILATALAGLIAIGIFELNGQLGYAGWQWLFIIQGSVTGLVGGSLVFTKDRS